MQEIEKRRLLSRMHRIGGQIRGLENRLISGEDPLLLANQFEAVISASKAALNNYLELVIEDLPTDKRSLLIKRLIRKG